MRGINIFRETKVPLHSWWKDPKGRVWVVVYIGYDEKDEPATVDILEWGVSEFITQPYSLIQKYIDDRTFSQILKPISKY